MGEEQEVKVEGGGKVRIRVLEIREKSVLIAVEKHEHVEFLNNYDVGREDAGKISKY